MSLARNAARMIARKGETMTLNRPGETSVDVKGKRIGGTLAEVGNTDQQRFRVKIGGAALAGSGWASTIPTKGGDGVTGGDTLTIGGRVHAILDVHPLSDGETVAVYELEVAG